VTGPDGVQRLFAAERLPEVETLFPGAPVAPAPVTDHRNAGRVSELGPDVLVELRIVPRDDEEDPGHWPVWPGTL